MPSDPAVDGQMVAALDAVAIFCTTPHLPDNGGKPQHRPIAPAICPIGIALAMPSVVLTPTPALPLPPASVLSSSAKERPPGRGPPPATTRVSAPRAPPLTA